MQHDLKPDQVWDIYAHSERRWRPARIVNIVMSKVELCYLDMPEAPDIARTFYAERADLERDPQSYRLTQDVLAE